MVHDGLASYKELDCTHSLCNSHHLRELIYIHENEGEKSWDSWAQEMMDLLVQALNEPVLRMCKVKQKISGCFRTVHGADTFFTIRSYLAAMNKQKTNLHACLVSVFQGQPIQPCFAG